MRYSKYVNVHQSVTAYSASVFHAFRCEAPGCIRPAAHSAPLICRLLSVGFLTSYLFPSLLLLSFFSITNHLCVCQVFFYILHAVSAYYIIKGTKTYSERRFFYGVDVSHFYSTSSLHFFCIMQAEPLRKASLRHATGTIHQRIPT